jgi:penicillin-binding protein 1B
MQVGLGNVSSLAARFGLPRPEPYPALALGTTEVTPLQVAAAYAAFVNDGKMVQPTFVSGLMDSSVQTTDNTPVPARQVISPTTAYMITDMLSDVTTRGTARSAKASFKNVAIAGKTGTSRDGWFVGYTPNLVCAVWIGYDDNEQLGLTGAEAALPAWIDFVKEAVAIRPSLGGASFIKPSGIRTVRIDPETGFLATPECPASVVVSVASRFAPGADCYKHRPPDSLYVEDAPSEVVFEESAVSPEVDTRSAQATKDEAALTAATGDSEERGEDVPPPIPTRRTLKEVDQRNRPALVNDPMVVDPQNPSTPARNP